MSAARTLYDELTDDLLYDPAVGRSTMMGLPCMRRGGRHFASFDTRGEMLVVKLPQGRVSELVAEGTALPFAPNGRTFREWAAIAVPDPGVWAKVLAEASDFAGPASRAPSAEIDELADRIRAVLADIGVADVREQRMFGGIAFLVNGHMAVAASREGGILLSVEREDTAVLLRKPHTGPMVMRGRELAGWLRVEAAGVRTRRQLAAWVRRGVDQASARPPKAPAKRRPATRRPSA